MAEHRIVMCNCRYPHPAIMFEDGSAVMKDFIKGGTPWEYMAEPDTMNETPHPDPDAVWADYCAWRLTNG